ncbi:MAG: hypothetical protein WBG28_08895 [Desulfobulbales bacterium]
MGVFRIEPRPKGTGVHGHPGVQVCIAPEDLRRKIAPGIRREMLLRGERTFHIRSRGRQPRGTFGIRR